MSIILNIDTAVQSSSICLAKNDVPLALKINPSQKDSAAWLHVAIKELLNEQNMAVKDLDAIAVTEGPGSYTGLRVGMSTAKGLCYVSKKPLITINTLQMMAVAAQDRSTNLICPMIDARRMEVFTAIFDQQLHYILPPTNLILDGNSLSKVLKDNVVSFFGDGSVKFQQLVSHSNAIFKAFEINALLMISLSQQKFANQEFTDLAYSHPFYGKDFHSSLK